MNAFFDAGRRRLAGGLLCACTVLLAPAAARAQAGEGLKLRGNVTLEHLILPRFEGAPDGGVQTNPHQARPNTALKAQFELSHRFDANWSTASRVFLREDVHNDDRDTARLDESWLQYATPDWDLRVGDQLVTWSSVESVSPLDVINPRDYEEDIVEPAKIGLTMARLRWRLPSSDLSLYWLPGFKPSRLPGPHSYYAIGGGMPTDHPDRRWDGRQWAARYFWSGDGLDVGLSYVRAIERNPVFTVDETDGVLRGSTYRSHRLGIDTTLVIEDLVLKVEAVYRRSHEPSRRNALLYALGAEYTLTDVWRHSELTLFLEYLASSRNARHTEVAQNDLFAGVRWTLNDSFKQRLQIGGMFDLDEAPAYVFRVEHQFSPSENVDLGARYTRTRNYYPGPRHIESDTGVFHLFLRYNY